MSERERMKFKSKNFDYSWKTDENTFAAGGIR
jgi:hypothetical protein